MSARLSLSLVFALVLGASPVGIVAAVAAEGPPTIAAPHVTVDRADVELHASAPRTPEEEAARVLRITNDERRAAGLAPLDIDPQLATVASSYAREMALKKWFNHVSPEGLDPFQRMDRAHIAYEYAGENIAFNGNAEQAAAALYASRPHRANILSTEFTRVGIGIFVHDDVTYVVEDFRS